MIRRSATRSLTRSPTPIKYDYDIYKKRSPTFGRRCPVLNRRPRNSSSGKNEANNNNRSKSSTSTSTVTITAEAATKTIRQQDQKSTNSSVQSSSLGCGNNCNPSSSSTSNSYKSKLRKDHELNVKPVSSRISSSIKASSSPSSSKGGRSIISSWDNPSYFQHDDRESQSVDGSGGGDDKKVSRKRKPRQSPFRWQHDLFEDDKSPVDKVESRVTQRKKRPK